MESKVIIFLAVFFFLISSVSAACPEGAGYLGNKNINECVRIIQTCSDCSYVNITSVVLSVSNESLLDNAPMVNLNNGEWIYNFCNTSEFGNYFVQGIGDISGTDTNFRACFDIGQNMTTSESIIYVLFVVILFLILMGVCYFIIILPGENDKNENDIVVGIVRLKYIRILLIGIAYPLIIVILNLMNGLAVHFATLGIFAGILGFFFTTMLRLAWPFTVIITLWILYLLIKDLNAQKEIDRLGRINLNGR